MSPTDPFNPGRSEGAFHRRPDRDLSTLGEPESTADQAGADLATQRADKWKVRETAALRGGVSRQPRSGVHAVSDQPVALFLLLFVGAAVLLVAGVLLWSHLHQSAQPAAAQIDATTARHSPPSVRRR